MEARCLFSQMYAWAGTPGRNAAARLPDYLVRSQDSYELRPPLTPGHNSSVAAEVRHQTFWCLIVDEVDAFPAIEVRVPCMRQAWASPQAGRFISLSDRHTG